MSITTNLRHSPEEEPHNINNHKNDSRKSNGDQLSLPRQNEGQIESNAYQNKEQTQNSHNNGCYINNKSTTTDILPENGQQPKPLGGGG